MAIFGKVFCFFDLLVLRGYCSNHLLSSCIHRTSTTFVLPVQPKVFIFQGKWNSVVFSCCEPESFE